MRGGNIRYPKDLLEYDPKKELEGKDGMSDPEKGEETV